MKTQFRIIVAIQLVKMATQNFIDREFSVASSFYGCWINPCDDGLVVNSSIKFEYSQVIIRDRIAPLRGILKYNSRIRAKRIIIKEEGVISEKKKKKKIKLPSRILIILQGYKKHRAKGNKKKRLRRLIRKKKERKKRRSNERNKSQFARISNKN